MGIVRKKILSGAFLGLFVCLCVFKIGQGQSEPFKSWLALSLIDNAWHKTLSGKQAKPWPWLESTPVAKLYIPHIEKEFVIMSGVSGDVLAYMPGWHKGTNPPGEKGVSMVSAHTDTHFSFLRKLSKGDVIIIERADSKKVIYEVDEVNLLKEHEIYVPASKDESVLLLSTHYPLENWQNRAEIRFVVTARALTNAKKDYLS